MGLNGRNRRLERILGAVLGTALFLVGITWTGRYEACWADTAKTKSQTKEERARAMEEQVLKEEKKSRGKKTSLEEDSSVKAELISLQKELLQGPKKDRLRFGGDFDMTHDRNPGGAAIHHEKGDTFFNLNPFAQLDLSGQKTDLRLEYRAPFLYNVRRSRAPGNDSHSQEGTVRFGRKILPRTLLSVNERLSRQSVRQAEKDNNKITWTQSHRTSLNYQLSKKFSVNLEGSHSRTDFPNEDYDQDYTRSFTFNPGLFFQMTPKTRFSGNFGLTYSRARVKTSDNRNFEYRIGYSGKITSKSSISVDAALSHQTPDAAEAAKNNKVVYSVGYIWQMTPKTSLRLNYSSSLTSSMTDAIATSGAFPFTKTRTLSRSDSLGMSTGLRIHKKINLELSFDGSHSRTKTRVSEGVPNDSKTRQWTFPVQAAIEYQLARWIRFRMTYTYRHQIGNEMKTDENRTHTWFVGSNLAF